MIEFRLPSLGDTVQEGLVTQWFKKVGDFVEVNEPLLEVTTDKVSIEVPSDYTGTLTEVKVNVGEKVHPDAVLCIMDES